MLQIIKYLNARNKKKKKRNECRPSNNRHHGAVITVVNINNRQLSKFKESAPNPLAEFHTFSSIGPVVLKYSHLLSDELKWNVRGRNRTHQRKNICSSKSC